MRLPVVLRREALFEFDQAADWYEKKRKGLGITFTRAIDQTICHLQDNPNSYAMVFQDVREALVKGFPYCIYFREEMNQILVLSIFHTARDPYGWQKRV